MSRQPCVWLEAVPMAAGTIDLDIHQVWCYGHTPKLPPVPVILLVGFIEIETGKDTPLLTLLILNMGNMCGFNFR